MKKTVVIYCLVIFLYGCNREGMENPYIVITHPDGPLFVGDLVSFEVLAPTEAIGQTITLRFNDDELGVTSFSTYGIGERIQGTFWWVWDTGPLEAGTYSLTFMVESGFIWNHTLSLQTMRQEHHQYNSVWSHMDSICCTIYYITETAAARDLDYISALADNESEKVADQFGILLQERIPLIFIPRVVGHGGFAWNGVYISYLDDNYVGSDLGILLHHEFVHYYDDWIGGEYIPAILQEGLAVYLSGGHFKHENLSHRAAALLDQNKYIPLYIMADDFYNHQHDIGYLEAAAFVQYLIDVYGKESFFRLYRTIPFQENSTDSKILDSALERWYSFSLEEFDSAFKDYLDLQQVIEQTKNDLELTVEYYDLVRRYQLLLDPSAYFLSAWLPDGHVMRDRSIVEDFTRRPLKWQNKLIESYLIELNDNLLHNNFETTKIFVKWIRTLLDFYENK